MQASHLVGGVSHAIRERGIAIIGLARNVERVAQMAGENHSTAQDASSAVHNLESLAEELESTVAKFKA